jgi:hypothetical protein
MILITSVRRQGLHWAAAVLLLASCSASADEGWDRIGGAQDAGSAGVGASSGDSGKPADGPTIQLDGPNAEGGPSDAEVCASQWAKADRVPLAMYILIDQSSSMADRTQTSEVKWDAITAALTSFVSSPDAADLWAGIQYFPLRVPPPGPCDSSRKCSGGAVCVSNNAQTLFWCFASCTSASQCAAGQECSMSTSGGTLLCSDQCDSASYANPDVEIGALSSTSQTQSITSSLNSHQPLYGTPTRAALQGGIDHCKAWGASHPDLKTIVVLATDGVPSECLPSGVEYTDPAANQAVVQVAQQGANGSPAVQTFVIGIFGPNDRPGGIDPVANLNAVAAAGGSGTAVLVDTTKDLTQQLLQALSSIRGKALECRYKIPAPDGGTLDFNKVNVQFTPGGGPIETLYYVADEAHCDPNTGGWHYDVIAGPGSTPSWIEMCAVTCSKLKSDNMGQVNIQLGCKTAIRPPA